MSLSGAGFGVSETVDLALHSTPSSLGTVSTNQSGDFVTTVTIPAGVSPGTHSIVAIGETSGATASFTFTLTAETTATAPSTTTSPTTTPSPSTTAAQAAPSSPSSPTSTGGLAFTGADVSALSALAAIAVAAGIFFLLTGRTGLVAGRLGRLRRSGRLRG